MGRHLKKRGPRGLRLGPAVVSGHRSERQGVCPLTKPRLISCGNNAGLGGPSLDTEYELCRFVLLDCDCMGQWDLMLSLSVCVSLCSALLSQPKSVFPSLSLLFSDFPLAVTEQFLFYRPTEGSLNLPLLLRPLGTPLGLFLLLWGLLQHRSADRDAVDAAMCLWPLRSLCSHGATERWAVPLLGNRASERAEDMLGQTPGDHCTQFCYYSNYCSNHGNHMEDWSILHCHSRHGCCRGHRRSQRWVCSITRWAATNDDNDNISLLNQ